MTRNTGSAIGGVSVNGSATLTLDALSRVTDNAATRQGGVGSIYLLAGNAELPSVANVTGNTPANCRGDGFTGPGAICTTT